MEFNDRYIIISPVKDEERYIKYTFESVLKQTLKPIKWIIVDDGSQDRTSEIINKYCKKYDWIKLLKIERDAQRQPGSAVIHAFNHGFELVKDMHFDFIVKLDCDLRFAPHYFEKILLKFHRDEKLGIASGIYLEKKENDWIPVKMPDYHAAGASKVVRVKCFKDINGFIPNRGWDTVDEIRALTMGWKTLHFKDLKFYHLKNEGMGIGYLQTNLMHGEIYYLTGGGKPFFLMKVIHRMIFGKPFFIGGLMMFYGFLRALVFRKKLLVNKAEAVFYKKLLNERVLNKFKCKGI